MFVEFDKLYSFLFKQKIMIRVKQFYSILNLNLNECRTRGPKNHFMMKDAKI
jgi:hypothetical protein